MSILIKEKLDNYTNLSLLISSVIYKVLSKILNNIKIKWPNDLVINNKKICGILLESVSSNKIDALIIGFGINVNTNNFSFDIKDKATSIFLETNNKVDITNLSKEIYNKFTEEYKLYKENKSDYLEINRKNSSVIGKVVSYIENGKEEIGEVIDILDNGHILLKKDNKYIEKGSGEISLHNNY